MKIAKYILTALNVLFLYSNARSQVFYYVDNSNNIYTFDLATCESTFVVNVQGTAGISDITFAPDNNLYAVSLGDLYRVDLATGQSTFLGSWNADWAPSLTCDSEGNIYTAGYGLYSYNIYDQTFSFHGDFPNDIVSAGDLTFRGDSLFMAAFSQKIVWVDIENPENSSVYFTYSVNDNIYGLSTFFINCDSLVSFGSGINDLYLIDFEGQDIIDLGCAAENSVYGLATPDEWQASDCTFSIDLDGDDSSDYLSKAEAGGFWSTVCTVPAPVADTDVVIEAGPVIDSISLQLDPSAFSNGPDEFLTGTPSPAVGISGSGTWQLTLYNTGAALPEDFEAALQTVLYHNVASAPNLGLRQITVTMWGQGGALNRTVMSNIDYLYAGPLSFSFGNDTLLCPGQVLELTIPYDYYHQVITSADTLTFGTFSWQDGSQGNTLEVSAPGVYYGSFVYEEAFGCSWADTIVVSQGDTALTHSLLTLCSGESFTIGNQTFTTDTLVCITYSGANSCDSTHCTEIVFLPPPPLVFIDTTLCQGGTVGIGNQVYNSSGTYTDTLTTWNGCDSIVQLDLTVIPADTTSLAATICEGETLEVGGLMFATTGYYEVPLSSQVGCDSLVQLDLTVIPRDTTELSEVICEGDTVQIGGQPFSSSGLYELLLSNQAGCDSLVRLNLTVMPLTVLQTDSAVCEGNSVFFGGQMLFEQGTYADTLAGQNNECDTLRILHLTVWPRPELTIQTTGNICIGEPLHLSADGTASTFLWSTGETQPAITATQAGTYSVTATDAQGCTAVDSVEVDFSEPLSVSVSAEAPTCYGLTDGFVEITDVAGGTPPYFYSINGGPESQTPFFGQLGGGTYLVVVNDAQGCQWSDQITLSEPAVFEIDAGSSQAIELGGEVHLEVVATQVPDSVWWLPPEGLACSSCLSTLAMPNESTLYQIFALNEAGCLAMDEVFIRVDKRAVVYAPTAFSPNADGFNDTFTLFAGKGVAEVEYLAIFNRWGGIVFEAKNLIPNDLSSGWNGTWQGEDAPPGVYVWLARLKLINGALIWEKGEVTLLR